VPAQSKADIAQGVLHKQPKRARWLDWLKTGIVAFAGLGLTVRFNLKEALASVAPILSCATRYLSAGANRCQIIGELTRFVDHLDEQTNVRYRNVHILAYSFGSVIALDTLFPQESELPKRMERVDTLVTIGCPADFIRTYWPKYFQDRRGKPNTPRRWLNVYNDADVLGSNFLDTFGPDTSKDKMAGICSGGELRRPNEADNIKFGPSVHSFSEWVRFIGFRVHSKYWDRQSVNAVSCFEPIVQRLYQGDAAIS
jgi:pimeloyl-ACP methyl ester carboxylesterase